MPPPKPSSSLPKPAIGPPRQICSAWETDVVVTMILRNVHLEEDILFQMCSAWETEVEYRLSWNEYVYPQKKNKQGKLGHTTAVQRMRPFQSRQGQDLNNNRQKIHFRYLP
ncbi:hypothetical protein DPMN_121202 [Dreissena polymorpha]|uniref:Uncharacterized protein n=1 Tax=Dreissena polymorpha TaxID=45954 RepID=A0A9D4GQC4_DREPO|nr:hypothetical protein DPMN_121202 [Dreissena polymorpha]